MRSASYVPNVGRHLSTSNLGPRRTEFIVDPATMLSSPLGAMDAMMSLEQVSVLYFLILPLGGLEF